MHSLHISKIFFKYKKGSHYEVLLSKLDFTVTLPADTDKLIALATDYKNFQKFFESQIKSVKIIESNNTETITEEILSFSTIFKHEIIQRSSHKQINPHVFLTKILSGPFKNSELQISYDKIDSGTKIQVSLNLQVDFKYKLLEPIIKKRYKTVLTGLLYKMNTIVQEYQS